MEKTLKCMGRDASAHDLTLRYLRWLLDYDNDGLQINMNISSCLGSSHFVGCSSRHFGRVPPHGQYTINKAGDTG
jgi:hypothetical protein